MVRLKIDGAPTTRKTAFEEAVSSSPTKISMRIRCCYENENAVQQVMGSGRLFANILDDLIERIAGHQDDEAETDTKMKHDERHTAVHLVMVSVGTFCSGVNGLL